MKDLLILFAKGLLWILLVLLLRPINYLLDVTLASYAKLSQMSDSDDLVSTRKNLWLLLIFVVFLIISICLGFLAMSKGHGFAEIPLISPMM